MYLLLFLYLAEVCITWLNTPPSSFVPSEDIGTFFINTSLPPALSLERTAMVANLIDSITRSIPEINNAMRIVGQNQLAGSGSSYAMEIVELKH